MPNTSTFPTRTPLQAPHYFPRVSEHEPEAEDDAGKDKKMSLDTTQAGRIISRNGATWHDKNRDSHTTIYYEFGLKDPVHQADIHTNFTEEQKDGLRKAMQSWSDIANIRYKENPPKGEWLGDTKFYSDNPDAEGLLAVRKHLGHGIGGKAAIGTADVWLGLRNPNENLSPRSVGGFVAMHEFGHNLGLPHPGHYNGSANYTKDALYAEDTRGHSIMSYFEEQENGQHFSGGHPWTPMMDDISAIQRIYGSNYTTRNTDTTYGFNSNTDRDALTFKSTDDRPVLCIWDGGGNDTLDCSEFTADQRINLNEQTFSNVAGLKGNVSIAKGVTLENAVGGHGNDHLIGNTADNRLTGGAGADRLTGGKGKDFFIYNTTSDSTPENPDFITDFISGIDSIDVSTLLKKSGVNSLNFVTHFSGRIGEAALGFDEKLNEGTLTIDLTGKGQATFLIKTHGKIYPADVVQVPSTYKPVDASPPRINPDGGRTDGYVPPAPIVVPPSVSVVIGTKDNDVLRGDHGDNLITGGAGADTLVGGSGRDIFVYEHASDSTIQRPDQILDFKTGVDTIDVSKALEKAGVHSLNFVTQFTRRSGDTVIRHNSTSNESTVGIDMTGNGKADLFIHTQGKINAGDILSKTI
ncbi:M10 family metallopeptidase C-terminal domain-containing protein [Pseudomonas veronii]|uniref:M10 family metallopeptidase C-terminal domain-containing protein n=1 Tax=Pseudomonas TaxID=286 RepID=UPI000D37D898|nr:M10 family metallopeptidase C-terminal domain-containing protein [Pseudomonas sp. GV105]